MSHPEAMPSKLFSSMMEIEADFSTYYRLLWRGLIGSVMRTVS